MAYPRIPLPNSQATVWYSHSIFVNNIEIGTFERFSAKSDRTHERIREIFFSRGPEVREIVWGGTDISVDVSRVELYNIAMFEAFDIHIYSLEDFNQYVQIAEIQHNPDPQGGGKRTITYTDCVPTSINKDIDTGTVRTIESMTFQVRTIRGIRS